MPRPARVDPAGAPGPDPAGVTVGVLGGSWRGRVTPWGAIVPADGSATLDWWIAAEDRWHTPAIEPTVRQRAVGGVPVVETAVRVPGGDVVQTVYAVADGGGFTVIELENRSPAGVAVALSRRDLVTSRPPAIVPVEGVDAPADALVVPIGHHASARVALAHEGGVGGARPADLPPPGAVVRGWIAQAGQGVDLRLPDVAPGVGLTTLRCALLLEGPPPPGAGAAHLVAVAELGRLGSAVEPWLDDAVVVAEAIGRRARRSRRVGWVDAAGLVATREVRRTSSPCAAGSRRPSPRRRTRRRGRWAWPGPSAGSWWLTPTARHSTCSRRPSPGRGRVSRSRPTASRSAAIRR